MALVPVPYELKDGFKRRFRHIAWIPEYRMWRAPSCQVQEILRWIAREQAKLESKQQRRAR